MKVKRLLILLLTGILCFGLVACNSGMGEDPETVRKDLAALSDAELIPVLLKNYGEYTEPAVFAAEMSWVYRSGESVIASMEGTVRTNGVDRMLTVTRTVEEVSKSESYIHNGGVFYMNADSKTKISAESADVAAYFATLYPSFGKVDDYNFTDNDLLRSEDGTYSLVLFLPANGIASSADITSPLTAVGNETVPVTMSAFTDIYLTLRFSADGKLTGQTLGFDCKMTADGVETEGTVLFRFHITSVDPVQTPISAPDDVASYAEAASDPFGESSDSSDDQAAGEDTSSDEE